MKYASEMGSGGMIYMVSLTKIGSGIPEVNHVEIHRHTNSIEIA
jgi:hypothetical protein